uniref:DUF4199 domain-containing protein n=2 Tax=Flavobacterium sp. TaxID=239 RepID=UPI00404980E0
MKQFSIEFRWAFTYLLAQTLWIMLEKTLGFHQEKIQYQPVFSMLFIFVLILIYTLAIREKKAKVYQGNMTWREGFVSGLMLTLIMALFTTMTEYTKHNVISPYFLDNMKALILKEGKMSVENANEFFSFSNTLSQSIFYVISVGVVITSIVSLIVRSKVTNQPQAATPKVPSKKKKK